MVTLKTLMTLFDKQRPIIEKILKRLLETKGIEKYIVFDYIEEASEVLPGGIFPISGELLTSEDKVYYFWLGWDESLNDYELGESDGTWREISVLEYDDDPSVQLARKRLGLQFNKQVIDTVREELASLAASHSANYGAPPPITEGLHEDLPAIVAKLSQWNRTITNWTNEYLLGNLKFSEHTIEEMGKHLWSLSIRLGEFRNETHDESYNPYINWESSLSRLYINLRLLANLESKIVTIFRKI